MKLVKISILCALTLLAACAEKRERSIKPENWFPESKLTYQHYSHFVFTYGFETNLNFEQILSIVRSELGTDWSMVDESAEQIEARLKIMTKNGIEILGSGEFSLSKDEYGAISLLFGKTIDSKESVYTLLVNVNDPTDNPMNTLPQN